MGMSQSDLDDWIERMVDLKILKPDPDGIFVPYEDYFRCRLQPSEQAHKRRAAAARGRNLKPAIDSMDGNCRKAIRVVRHLSRVSGVEWAIKDVDSYSPLVERVANIIADGIEDGRSMRARIALVAKGCRDDEERKYKLRPSYIFPEDFGKGLKQVAIPHHTVVCSRCSHSWTPRSLQVRQCPKCKTLRWDAPREYWCR